MGSALRTNQPHEALPPEIYLPLVDSLFKEGRTLFAGTILGAGSVFITYWKTGEVLLLYCAIAVLIVAALRGLTMRAYLRARPAIKTVEAARHWEHIYVAGAATSIALLGLWCFLAFARTSDPFTQLVSFSMTIAYTTGIFGRLHLKDADGQNRSGPAGTLTGGPWLIPILIMIDRRPSSRGARWT